jgi:MFS transporter, MHS family, alpha-ketoglutarate permease
VTAVSSAVTPSRSRLRPLAAAAVGNVVEWFDFTIYATFAVYFSPLFFPSEDPTASLLSTFAVFAVGFFVRPLGGWLLGAYADRRGRRKALLLTVVLMTAPAFVIGIAPTYASIGVLAPIVLVLARMVQGFAAGGESGGAMAYLNEIAPPHRKGLYSSLWYATVVLGMVLASLMGYVLTRALPADAMADWGWRIPFLVGGAAGLLALWVRKAMVETSNIDGDTPSKERPAGLRTLLSEFPRETLQVVLLMAGAATSFYTFVSYMPTHLINSVGLSASVTFGVHTLALLVFMVLLPIFGHLSDRIGRRPFGLAFSLGGAVAIYPLSQLLSEQWLVTLLVDLALLTLTACMFSVLAAMMTELFPMRMRAMGVGAPYNLATAIFGGTAPFLLTWLAGQGRADWYFIYLSVLVLLVTVGVLGASRARPAAEQPG